MQKFHDLCSLNELEEGRGREFVVEDRAIAVFRQGDNVFCVDNKCYHNGAPLHLGDIEDIRGATCIVCPWHRYIIEAATGAGVKPVTRMLVPSLQRRPNKQRVHIAKVTGKRRVLVQLTTSQTYGSDRHYVSDTEEGLAAGISIAFEAADTVTVPFERFDELIVAEAIATAHTAQPSNIDIAALLSHGMPSAGVNQNAIVLSAAQFLYTELPVRFAANLVRFDQLLTLMKQKGVRTRELQNVRDGLMRDFRELRVMDMPKNMRQEAALSETIQRFITSHARLQATMARGVYNVLSQEPSLGPALQTFLDTFFTNRIGSSMLMQHHMGLREKPRREGYVGTIALECSLHEIIHDAVDHANSLFIAQHGFAPPVEFLGEQDTTFPYIPEHIHYIVFELVKNAMGATFRRHHSLGPDLPPVQIVIGGKDTVPPKTFVGFEIRDQGGGVPLGKLEQIFYYGYTSAKHSAANEAETPQEDEGTRIAGYGFGLPLSRLYARYFGGDIVLRSVPQYGTCASVLLSTTKRTYILHEAQKGAESVGRVETREYEDGQ